MKSIEVIGKNVEEAIKSALIKLNTDKNSVEIDILDEGNKGFFKIGSRPARVKATLKRNYIEEVKMFLSDLLKKMGFDVEIIASQQDDIIKIELKGKNMGILIGYRGETLDSIQYLVNLFINKEHEGKRKKVVIDIENYRFKREETLRRLAVRLSHKVQKSKRVIKLEPMNPYERRIIHAALQNDKFVKTYSEGEEPNRRVVLDLKKA